MSEGVIIALLALSGVLLSPAILAVVNDYLSARRTRIKEQKEKENREREALATVEALQETVASMKLAYAEQGAELDFYRKRTEHLERLCFGGVQAQ